MSDQTGSHSYLRVLVTGKPAGRAGSGKDFGHGSGTGTGTTFGSRVGSGRKNPQPADP